MLSLYTIMHDRCYIERCRSFGLLSRCRGCLQRFCEKHYLEHRCPFKQSLRWGLLLFPIIVWRKRPKVSWTVQKNHENKAYSAILLKHTDRPIPAPQKNYSYERLLLNKAKSGY